jgi:hypothetical protein
VEVQDADGSIAQAGHGPWEYSLADQPPAVPGRATPNRGRPSQRAMAEHADTVPDLHPGDAAYCTRPSNSLGYRAARVNGRRSEDVPSSAPGHEGSISPTSAVLVLVSVRALRDAQ